MFTKWIILASVAMLLFISSPLSQAPGDANAARFEALSFLSTGKFIVQNEMASSFGGEPGQYFVQDQHGNLASKYGVMNTLMYVPAVFLNNLADKQDLLLALNVQGALLGALGAMYLFLLASRYCHNRYLNAYFVFVCVFGSFWWYHLRAHAFEVHYVTFALAAFYHAMAFRDHQRHILHCSLCGFFLALLVAAKSINVLLVPIFVAYAFGAVSPDRRWRSAVIMAGWTVVGVGVAMMSNWDRTGSPFDAGYTQWAAEPFIFSGNLWRGLWGYATHPQYSVFVCFPMLAVALCGWREFIEKYKVEAILILASSFVMFAANAKFHNWQGAWSYGPRYILPYLPVLSLPAVIFIERHLLGKFRVGWILALAVTLVFAVRSEIKVNSHEPFTYYYLEGDILQTAPAHGVETYFAEHTFPMVLADFDRWLEGGEEPGAVKIVRDQYGDDVVRNIEKQVRELLGVRNFRYL